MPGPPPCGAHALTEASTSEDAPVFPHGPRNTTGLCLGMLPVASGFGLSLAFGPLLLGELGITENVETWSGYAVGGFFWLSVLLTPFWGVVADHFGRKSMVMRTGLGMGLSVLLLSVTPSPLWFVLIYILAGTTQGFVGATQALLVTTTAPERMGRGLTLLQSANMIGNAIGPALGAALALRFHSYRILFAVGGGLILCGGLISVLTTREERQRPDAPFRLSLLSDAARIFRIPGVLVLYGGGFVFAMTLFGSISVISIYIAQLLEAGGSAGEKLDLWVAAASVAITISSSVAVHGWGWLLEKLGPERSFAISLLLGALGVLPVIFVQTPWQLVAARVLTGASIAGIIPAQVAMTKMRAPKGMEARVLAYGSTCTIAGMATGPVLAGIIGPWLGLRAYFAFNAALVGLVGLRWLQIQRRSGYRPSQK